MKYFILLTTFCYSAFSMSQADARRFCDNWLPALVKSKSPELTIEQAVDDLLINFYSRNTKITDPNFNTTLTGENVRSYYLSIFSNYPEWSFPLEKQTIYPTPKGFVLEYYGTIPNALTGHIVEDFRGVDIIEMTIENGKWKIASLKGYYDRKPFTEPLNQ